MEKVTARHRPSRIFTTATVTLTIAAAVLLCAQEMWAAKPKRTAGKVRTEQQATKRQIKETSRKITINTKETRKQLSRLDALSTKIAVKNSEITTIRLSIDSIDGAIRAISGDIDSLNTRIAQLQNAYTTAMRKLQGENTVITPLAFIFAAQSFTDATRRIRYIRQFNEWRKAQQNELRSSADELSERKSALSSLRQRRQGAATAIAAARSELESSKAQTAKIVDDLKHETASLKALLKEKEEQARRLDRELDRIIEEERREQERRRQEEERRQRKSANKSQQEIAANKPNNSKSTAPSNSSSKATTASSKAASTVDTSIAAADRQLTGSFESNKGSLLFPVSGRYRIVRGFGRQKHPELEQVETDNSGIDIEALSSTKARAIYNGRVSAIFRQPGYGTIVMIRHGKYLTIYANLDAIAVKSGDTVKTGQTIGNILADPEEENRTILHFELRKERTKLNPTHWIK